MSFAGEVRKGRLASPVRRDFDASAWSSAYGEVGRDSDDRSLHETGLWLADRLSAHWSAIGELGLERLPLPEVARLVAGLCASLHLQVEAGLALGRLSMGDTPLPMGSAAYLRLSLEDDESATADAIRTSSVDTWSRMLRYFYEIERVARPGRFDPASAAAAMPHFEAIYTLEFLWQQTLWQGWSAHVSESEVVFSPPPADRFGTSKAIADWRRDLLVAEFEHVYDAAWAASGSRLPPVVTVAVKGSGPSLRLLPKTLHPGEGPLPSSVSAREMIAASELSLLMDKPLPSLDGGVTLADLLDAWHLLAGAATCLVSRLFKKGPPTDPRAAALVVQRLRLRELFVASGWSEAKAEAALGFFTYRGQSADGLWSKPLIEVSPNLIAFAVPAVITANLYRSAELWVTEADAGELFRERGGAFEDSVRQQLRRAVAEAGLSERVYILPEAWKSKIKKAVRDIDLLFRVENRVFLGELKYKKYPVMPAEYGRWIEEFHHAAAQLKIRVDHFAVNKAELARRTDFAGNPETLDIIGFILIPVPFGAGVSVDGFPVVDLDMLLEFFTNRRFIVESDEGADVTLTARDIPARRSIPFELPGTSLAASLSAHLKSPLRIRYGEGTISRASRSLKLPDGLLIRWTEVFSDAGAPLAQDQEQLFEELRAAWQRDVTAEQSAVQ